MSPRPRPRPLRVERLEDRDVPTVWGTPWPDGQFLTLSLAPDGTNISGAASNLSQILSQAGTNGEIALLEAFQTWADYANINFGLVNDGGEAFGVGKAIQDDPRFGDIRIGARPLDSDVLAVTSPFDYFNTYSGDVVLNSSQPIGATYNLYAVALHEAGHALGLPDNSDPNSVMYEYYTGTNTALDAGDIAAIQSLYGARGPAASNNSFAKALTYTTPVYAQLNTPTEADYYKFATPLLFTGTTINLQAEGVSLLDATVSVYSSNGKLVASSTATNPESNNVTLDLNGLAGLSTYYVVVSSPNGGVFDMGSYNLTISNNLTTAVSNLVGGLLDIVGGVGHTLLSATNLIANATGLDAAVNYNARSSLNSGSQTDYYAVQAPASAASENMIATVWTLNNQSLTPRIEVFNSEGDPVAFQVLTDTAGASTIQVLNAVPGAKYKLEVDSASGQTGSYAMSVSYLSSPILFPLTASGTLTGSASSTSASLDVPQSQMMHFVLTAGAASDPDTLVMMTITDGNGDVVASIEVSAGQAESIDVFLGVGTYTVTVSAETTDGSALSSVGFELGAIGITDPVGLVAQSPTSTPTGTTSTSSSSPTTTTTSPPTSPPPASAPTSTSTTPTTVSSTPTSSWSGTTPSTNSIWN